MFDIAQEEVHANPSGGPSNIYSLENRTQEFVEHPGKQFFSIFLKTIVSFFPKICHHIQFH